MKIASLFLFSLLSVHSAQIWSHPNVQAALPATPVAPAELQLDSASIEREFPQNSIWFSGEWVGYFANEWRAPVWTTLAVPPPEFSDESSVFESISFPEITIPSTVVPIAPVFPPGILASDVPEPGFLTLWPIWLFAGTLFAITKKSASGRMIK